MSLGNARMHKYVVHELIRRCKGRTLRRRQKGTPPISYADTSQGIMKRNWSENLVSWHHMKTPFIRMVSNAVPRVGPGETEGDGVAQEDYSDFESKSELFGTVGDGTLELDNNLRKYYTLFGGQGAYNAEDDMVKLPHTFGQLYGDDVGIDTTGQLNVFRQDMKDGNNYGLDIERNLRPMPGITSVDVSYKGSGMGALKKATINFTCYSLSDLEKLETFYMYPGIKVLLEWGWSINTAMTEDPLYTSSTVDLISLDDETMGSTGKIYDLIGQKRRASGGCYDGMFGTIVNFSWSVNPDMSFRCTTELTDVGDSIFIVNPNTSMFGKEEGSDSIEEGDRESTKLEKEKTLTGVCERLKKEIKNIGNNKIEETEVNFKYSIGKTTIRTYRRSLGGDTDSKGRSRMLYVRFGDVVDNIMNKLYALGSATKSSLEEDKAEDGGDTKTSSIISQFCIGGSKSLMETGLTDASPDDLMKADPQSSSDTSEDASESTEDDDRKMEVGPISVISNAKLLISVNPAVCLLGNQTGDQYPFDPKTTRRPSGLTGEGCDFAVPSNHRKALGAYSAADPDATVNDADHEAGYLANIFVNVDVLVEEAEGAQDLRAFLMGVTNQMNQACCNVWNFQWRTIEDHPGFVTCVDTNFKWSGKTEVLEFSLNQISGIVRNLSMKSRISKEMMNHLFIAANAPVAKGKVTPGELQSKNVIPLDVDFTLDGISGIQFGTVLGLDYLPARYLANTYLFAKGINQSISPAKWDTTITCGFRWQKHEEDLVKIKLGKLNDIIRESEEDNISEEDLATEAYLMEVVATKPPKQHVAGEGSQLYPESLFRSLEAENLTIGQDENGDPKSAEEYVEKKKSIGTLKEEIGKAMRKVYQGTNVADHMDEAYSLLDKILNFEPEDGIQEYVATKKEKTKKSKGGKKKKKDTNQSNTDTQNKNARGSVDESGRQTQQIQNQQMPLGPGDMN
tara:strand:- start:1057 stop:3942 length:2886 start_codon:yes stop_codon:yes gene_type:complete